MKVWYDKEKLDLTSFISEKFLFLPLYDKAVIDKDNDFKGNNWADDISKTVVYTSIEDAEYLIYHDKLNEGIGQFIADTVSFNHKPILAFYNSDNTTAISSELPDNVFVFRTSFFKSMQTSNELALPAWSEDFGAYSLKEEKKQKPVIGFCGALTHPSRLAALNELRENEHTDNNFIVRDLFWGGAIHDKTLRREYIENTVESDLILCCRGAGNFSYRLYECMSMGRIPIIIDADTPLPCDDVIEWERFIVTTVEDVNRNVNSFWHNISPKEYKELQAYARHVYSTYLSPDGFAKYISEYNPIGTKEYTKSII
tara:strand:- start:5650 stop:6588 length:939 start_codon:yes stop_codon:yes gene_type:complete